MEADDLQEVFSSLGEVSIRRMFGGKGIYHEGLIIAVELRGDLLLKGDAATAVEVEAAGGRRWAYEGAAGKSVQMPYWSIPETAWDDADEMGHWVRLAFEAARRAPAKPARASRKTSIG